MIWSRELHKLGEIGWVMSFPLPTELPFAYPKHVNDKFILSSLQPNLFFTDFILPFVGRRQSRRFRLFRVELRLLRRDRTAAQLRGRSRRTTLHSTGAAEA